MEAGKNHSGLEGERSGRRSGTWFRLLLPAEVRMERRGVCSFPDPPCILGCILRSLFSLSACLKTWNVPFGGLASRSPALSCGCCLAACFVPLRRQLLHAEGFEKCPTMAVSSQSHKSVYFRFHWMERALCQPFQKNGNSTPRSNFLLC